MISSKRFNIVAIDNMIGGRQGWAYICNSRKFAVLKADLDKEQEYETYKTYGEVKVIAETKTHGELPVTARLADSEGTYKLTSWGCGIHSQFNFHDMMELIEEANLPQVRENEVVAVAEYSKEFKQVILKLFKVGKLNIHCQTVATLNELTEEEMKDIVKDAEKWCMR